MAVDIRAHARIHFGGIDLSGSGGRRIGGFGLTIARPRCVLRIERAAGLAVEGDQAERIEVLATRVHEALEIQPQARIRVLEAIPQHVGLGSGTQLNLALAAGIASLRGLDLSIGRLCSLLGRARRSGVGYHLFRRGGFVLEGGYPLESGPAIAEAPPLLARHQFPRDWKILVAIPSVSRLPPGGSAAAPARPAGPPAEGAIDRIARLLLTELLPAILERELRRFADALAEIQALSGDSLAADQEAEHHPGADELARVLKEAGACAAGKSLWGPAVYGLAADDRERQRLAAIIREADPEARLYATRGWNRGAVIDGA